jgi:diadenosine tetraphosphatase ApaH/serine/threonine PP2A family protein phosphatase
MSTPIVVCGHTHTQFERTIAGKRVLNSGSVGMPYEDAPGAYWTLDLMHCHTEAPNVEREDAISHFESLALGARATDPADPIEASRTHVDGRRAPGTATRRGRTTCARTPAAPVARRPTNRGSGGRRRHPLRASSTQSSAGRSKERPRAPSERKCPDASCSTRDGQSMLEKMIAPTATRPELRLWTDQIAI